MRKYLFIATGGFIGANLRFIMGNLKLYGYNGLIPLNTLTINITGSFLLAFFLTISFEILQFNSDIRTGIATGFFGAYTTFSTLCKEITLLITKGSYLLAFLYIFLSITLGLSFAYLGIITARKFISKFASKEGR